METRVKLFLVGDGAVDKTYLRATHQTGVFPTDYMPNVENDYTIMVKGHEIAISLWDMAGREEYERIRALSYPNTSTFVLPYKLLTGCLTVYRCIYNMLLSRSSRKFGTRCAKWLPEIKNHCPNASYILVGTQMDLRTDPKTLERLAGQGSTVVTTEEGMEMARRIGAYAYAENSSLTQDGLRHTIEIAVIAALDPLSNKSDRPVIPPIPIGPKVVAKDIDMGPAFTPYINNKEFSDVTFVTKDKTEFYAHKVILLTSMPCFNRALYRLEDTLPTCFKSRAEIVINDCTVEQLNEPMVLDVDLEPQVFHLILKYIYNGLDLESNDDVPAEDFKQVQEFFEKYPRYTFKRHQKLIDLALSTKNAFADAFFVLDNNVRRPAHKVLLAAASEYFANLFKEDPQLVDIQVPGVESVDIYTLKEFLYAGCGRRAVLETNKNVPNMLRLAHKFNLPELMSHCEVFYQRNIDRFDLGEVYQRAVLNNCPQLKAYLEYLMIIRYDDVKEQWFDLDPNTRERIEREQWPGRVFHEQLKEWQKKHKKDMKDKKDKKSGDKECTVM